MALKLFVWQGVLSDYSDGIAFALAESEEQAREMLLKERSSLEDDCEFKNPPDEYETPIAFAINGGG